MRAQAPHTLDELVPPPDPREGREDVPRPGAMPTVTALDELTTRVLADNPGPLTLDGTNTYVVGEPGSGAAVVVDPGPDDPEHRAAVEGVLADRDATPALVAVTHHHPDHAAAARAWAAGWGCPVAAVRRDVTGPDGRQIADGDRLPTAGMVLEVVATPGHSDDHVALRLPTGALLVGDHVLGRGTSVVAHPDGDLAAYLDSLRRVLRLGPDALYPGHGPALTEDPVAVLAFYREHRRFRIRQILAALADGPRTPRELVEVIYADHDPAVLPAAEASTRAALRLLAVEGAVADAGGGAVALIDAAPGER